MIIIMCGGPRIKPVPSFFSRCENILLAILPGKYYNTTNRCAPPMLRETIPFRPDPSVPTRHGKHICRYDGIGRRSGLKIRFVNAGPWARKPLFFLDFFASLFFKISDGPPEWTSDFRRSFLGLFIENHTCRYDGIGRRSGLKIHRWRHRAGSTPATGTIHSKARKRLLRLRLRAFSVHIIRCVYRYLALT